MANYQGHLIAGAITGGSIELIRKIGENKPLELHDIAIFCAQVCVGSMGGVLPDKLEPAIHPHHRKFFHSGAMILLISAGLYSLWKTDKVPEWVKWTGTALGAAYGLHLLIDGFTPAGLPVA